MNRPERRDALSFAHIPAAQAFEDGRVAVGGAPGDGHLHAVATNSVDAAGTGPVAFTALGHNPHTPPGGSP